MKQNSGITVITLVITILVIVIIASITIYTGMDTVSSIRTKQAKDATNAIYLALVANEEIIPSGKDADKMLSDYDEITDRSLTDKDFELMGLDYTTQKCTVSFDKYLSGDNTFIYEFTYVDELNNIYDNLIYSAYKEKSKTNQKAEFDNDKKVNRPVLSDSNMIPLNYNGEKVNNVYTENWYNYEKNFSKLATMKYDEKTFAWIPRFAYKIQNFYLGKSYDSIPSTAIDIIFLREDTDHMSNNEILPIGYTVHPAFEDGVTGFWIATDPVATQTSVAGAASSANVLNGHLMKNSEYAAAVFLMRAFNNSEINFGEREFVAAVCDEEIEGFDVYSSDYYDVNYIGNASAQALLDTPWDLKDTPSLPTGENKYLIRNVNKGGMFYYESAGNATTAAYRIVITK